MLINKFFYTLIYSSLIVLVLAKFSAAVDKNSTVLKTQTSEPLYVKGNSTTTNGPTEGLQGAEIRIVNPEYKLDGADTTDVNTTITGIDDSPNPVPTQFLMVIAEILRNTLSAETETSSEQYIPVQTSGEQMTTADRILSVSRDT